ncbi:unnamed protein product [Prorocentrum cordatum]|uniref:Microcystin degradation protein MlrC n=1 Tax=Prorocentrum cordatum TaxID=2364126 RepID=A0ABN9QPN8_9DINO|nr:unnamed protein product [Polarella glacialis]
MPPDARKRQRSDQAGEHTVVGIFSFALESNAFNPEPRRLSSFQFLEGKEYEKDERQSGFVRRLRAAEPELFGGVVVRFGVLYRGWCGGVVPAEDFARMKATAVEQCRSMLASGEELAGLYFDLHGAMGAEGCDDAEAELVEAVRGAAPRARLASASFDLHANVSERLCAAIDLAAAYKTFPHADMEETKTKALRMLLVCLRGVIEPRVVVVTIPAILEGEKVLTTEGHGQELYRWLRDLEPSAWRTPELVELLGPVDERVRPVRGLLDASFFVGHGCADESRVGAAVVLSGEASAVATLRELARTIAQWYWDRRKLFAHPAGCPLLQWAAAEAEILSSLAAGRRVLLGDLGDNTNAGASGDVPFVCRRLLRLASHGSPRMLVAGLVDRAAVEACAAVVAEGRDVLPAVRVGAGHALGARYGVDCGPLELRGARVRGLVNGGAWAVLEASPALTIVLQRSAWAFLGHADVERLTDRFHPASYDVVVVKGSVVGPLAEHLRAPGESPQRTACVMALTPGAAASPQPPRPRLRPGTYPEDEDSTWTAPAGSCAQPWRSRR